jgi:putative transposase
MRSVCLALIAYVVSRFRPHDSLRLEHMALRHQLAVYQHTVKRPQLSLSDRLFWSWLSRLWPGWQRALAFVQPRTVMAWQKKRFRDYWRQLSQSGTPGRPAIANEVRVLIQDRWRSHPLWGSPRIVGERRQLGIHVAQLTVEKYRPKRRQPSSPPWKAFLHQHVKDLVACDFFTVPTTSCKVLFVFMLLAHERRRIRHFNLTEHPTAPWTSRQIVEAFPWASAPRDLLRDRDSIDSAAFQARVNNLDIAEVKIAPRSPWQHPDGERVIGSRRRDLLDPVVVLNARHLQRVLTAYLSYDHRCRTHLSLEMDGPHPRAVEPPEGGQVMALPEVGGLHHHDARQAA